MTEMILPAPVFIPVLGEDSGARVVRIVRSYVGCALHDPAHPLLPNSRFVDLAALVGRGVDDESIAYVSTNCGTFSLGVLKAAGCQHKLLTQKYVSGMAIAWLNEIGQYFSAWRTIAKDGPPLPGCLCWYEIAGLNDDHVEWELDNGDHGGGGRADNGITVEHGPVTLSLGRPMKAWLDITSLLPDTIVTDS